MKHRFKNYDLVGQGKEKNVYSDPENEHRVIAKIKENKDLVRTPNQLKGRFYLTKILHLLYPKFIPDIHLAAAGEENILVLERKNLDEEHVEHNQLRAGSQSESSELKDKYKKLLSERDEKFVWDDEFIDRFAELSDLGVEFDPSSSNFGYDDNGNLVYADNSFDPWVNFSDGNHLKKFNAEKIRESIGTLEDTKKEQALKYLKRLEELYQDELDY